MTALTKEQKTLSIDQSLKDFNIKLDNSIKHLSNRIYNSFKRLDNKLNWIIGLLVVQFLSQWYFIYLS